MFSFQKTSLLLAIVLLFTACLREESVNVNQDSIYAEYRLVYEADKDKTFARATFRFGGATGTLLQLSDPAEVLIDQEPMTWKPALAYYERESAGAQTSGTFAYTDLDANTFTNAVTLAKPIAFPAGLDTIAQGAAFTLTWEGDPIQAGELVTVTINGINEGDAKIFTTDNIGANEIILAADKLNGLGVGKGTIYMERFQGQLLQEGTSKSGAVWSRYLTGPREIQVK